MQRRDFIRTASGATALSLAPGIVSYPVDRHREQSSDAGEVPWYRRSTRWGQTNITEKDPDNYDIKWWRRHWKETAIQGVIINAGGIFAYYPSKVPLHRQAEYLRGRDLFGELCSAAHEEGLAVFARMDSNRAHGDFYQAHPDWFAEDASGNPYKAGDLYITCVNGPYYSRHIPEILTEIATLYKPEGFTDNSWSGLGRDSACYCNNCRSSFRKETGREIPLKADWNDQTYREWILWNYRRRLEIWDLNNETTRKAGGKNCIWSGMNSGSLIWQSESFRDLAEICKRAEIIMLDSQARSDSGGFQQNSDMGKLIHGLLGWNKLVPESMAMYQAGRPVFRLASKPAPEARMWMLEGIAGGIQPWWHYVGAKHEDKRIYHTPGPVFQWHRENQEYLVNRKPVATVGVVWSQLNIDFYGRDDAETLVEQPWRGIVQSLIRARIPYIPVHADHIDREAGGLSLLILPALGVMTDGQIEAVQRFSRNGKGLLVTGETSLYNELGDKRKDFGLNQVLGTHYTENGSNESQTSTISPSTVHTYLRLLPLAGNNTTGTYTGALAGRDGERHAILMGFDETEIIAFGGTTGPVKTDPTARVLMTYIPQFPVYPPETAWMRVPATDIPGLIINTLPDHGRVVFLPADIDRQFARHNLPDHGNLLENIVRWASAGNIPIRVKGAGLLDCNCYLKDESFILHVVNLTSTATWRQPLEEFIPTGHIDIAVMLPDSMRTGRIKSLVSGKMIPFSIENGWCSFSLDSVSDHEVLVIS